jgi:hypothetical protein
VESGSLQVVDALRKVLIGEMLNALDLHEQSALHHQIRRIRSYMLAFVSDWERRLGCDPESAETEFFQQRPLVDLL